jgi:hypothetical protein
MKMTYYQAETMAFKYDQRKKKKCLVFLPIYNGKDYDVGCWNPNKRKKKVFKGGFTVESERIF